MAVDLLDKNEMSVTPVFVSIDPERDTPEVVGDFVKYHHPKMIGLTGSKNQISLVVIVCVVCFFSLVKPVKGRHC